MKKFVLALLLLTGVCSMPTAEAQLLPRRPILPRPQPTPTLGENYIGGPEYDGRVIRVQLPADQLLKNKVGTDRAGLCVFTSIDEAARWQNVTPLIGFRDFMTKYPGGGWPNKVDKFIELMANGKPVGYIQNTSGDEALFKLAMKTGRCVCMTYGFSPRYIDTRPGPNYNPSGEINHMVICVYLDEKWMVINDNNFPETYEWIPVAEGFRRWKMRDGGWLVVLLNPPPPPRPFN